MRWAMRVVGWALLCGTIAARGQWSATTQFDQDKAMDAFSLYQPSGMNYAFLYSNGIRFGSNKAGPFELTGHWNGKVFVSAAPAGKGEIETAKILDNGDLELHASAFDPGDNNVYILHKVGTSRAQTIVATPAPAVNVPGPHLAYPPPKGTITVGMSRADLEKLPWRRDGFTQLDDEPRAQVYLYTYHCDDPTLVDLAVTVKNGKVISVNGGNG